MLLLKKPVLWLSLMTLFLMQVTPANAAMVSTNEVLSQKERTQLVQMLQRQDVQKQLIAMGVDPQASINRVDQLSDAELKQLHDQIGTLPAGAGISTVDLLLIIIIILLIA